MISSFDHNILKELKELFPKLRTSLLYGHVLSPEETVAMVRASNADFIHPALSCVNKAIVDECRRHGIGCNVWTVDSPEDIKKAIEMEPTGIITNVPDRVLKALGRG
jgi:glycerophosphoryl diester phosphodiesterase